MMLVFRIGGNTLSGKMENVVLYCSPPAARVLRSLCQQEGILFRAICAPCSSNHYESTSNISGHMSSSSILARSSDFLFLSSLVDTLG